MNFLKPLIICVAIATSILSCSKDKESNNVSIQTTTATILNHRSVKTGGVIENSTSSIVERGICYSINQNPSLVDNKVSDNKKELGRYETILNNLSANTKYYARAYVVNESGTQYGNQIEFTTPDYPTENIWWLNDKIHVINEQNPLMKFSWTSEKNLYIGSDNGNNELNSITVAFKSKPTLTKKYKLVNKKQAELNEDECIIVVSNLKSNLIYIYMESTEHNIDIVVEGGKCSINIPEVNYYEQNDISKTQPVKFKAILKEK